MKKLYCALLFIPIAVMILFLAFLSGCGGSSGGGGSAITAEGGYIYDSEWSIFSTTPTTLNFPSCVAVNNIETPAAVYICDYYNNRVFKVDKSKSFLFPVINIDIDPAMAPRAGPRNISLDAAGNLYIADTDNAIVVKYNSSGVKQTAEFTDDLKTPSDVTVDITGNVYVTDTTGHIVAKYESSGAKSSVIGGAQSTSDGKFNSPNGLAVDTDGNLFVSDTYNHRVQKFTDDLAFVAKWGTQGTSAGQFSQPAGIAVDSTQVFVADTGNNRIQIFLKDSSYVNSFGRKGSGPGQFNGPVDVAVDTNGDLYVADSGNNRIQVFRLQ